MGCLGEKGVMVGCRRWLMKMEGSMDGRAIGKREGGRWRWKRGASVSLAKVQMREGLDRWCPKGGDLVRWRWEVEGGLGGEPRVLQWGWRMVDSVV
ncbi:hypothetical protein V6N12_032017 [Hibiscus sabdariffa]|uniref:Uncharacterized protein n=1 Tax=Hibiscus sabdariffa TaxID=183260 RepID=A0ABR2BYT9_9ROSI